MRASSLSRIAAALVVSATAGLALAPLAVLAVSSVAQQWYWPDLLPASWSLRAWRYVASPEAAIGPALLTSLGVALLVAVTSVVVAMPAARALALRDFAGKRLLTFTILLPVLTPPLAAAMGLHAVFLQLGLGDTVTAVVLVHLVPAIPYATLVLMGSFAQLDTDAEAQARTLGAGPVAVLTRVTLPALAPGIAVAATFAFLVSWSQYLLTLLVGGGSVLTLPLLLVGFVRGGDEAVGAAVALVCIMPTLALFAVASRWIQEA